MTEEKLERILELSEEILDSGFLANLELGSAADANITQQDDHEEGKSENENVLIMDDPDGNGSKIN